MAEASSTTSNGADRADDHGRRRKSLLGSLLRWVKPTTTGKKRNDVISKQLRVWQREEGRVVQLLLLGTGESGKSTLTKQMKIIHINGFNDEERRERVAHIRKNLRDSILTILGALNNLDIPLRDRECQESRDYLMQVAATEEDYSQEFYDHTARLWRDPDVQQCYLRSNEYQLIDSAKYFLDRINSLRNPNYLPTNQDILRCRVMTNCIQRIDFSVKHKRKDVLFRAYDVGGQRGERQKWIQVFDGVTAIVFLVDCSSYDMCLREDPTQNRLLEALEIFEKVWNNRYLSRVSIILFINKIDLLPQKVNRGQLFSTFVETLDTDCPYYQTFCTYHHFRPSDSDRKEFLERFPRGDPADPERLRYRGSTSYRGSTTSSVRPDINDEVVRTAVFIKRVFEQLARSPVSYSHPYKWHSDHSCEVYYTCAIDTHTIADVMEACRHFFIKEHLRKYGLLNG